MMAEKWAVREQEQGNLNPENPGVAPGRIARRNVAIQSHHVLQIFYGFSEIGPAETRGT
ncbi:MAG: hypothetical protein IPL83_16345 [Bdellovibrionales bacterium]|nr:hypothetical protein [Bdellovibrionales bacterium]